MKPLNKPVKYHAWNEAYDIMSLSISIEPFDNIEWLILRATQSGIWFNVSALIELALEERIDHVS